MSFGEELLHPAHKSQSALALGVFREPQLSVSAQTIGQFGEALNLLENFSKIVTVHLRREGRPQGFNLGGNLLHLSNNLLNSVSIGSR